VPCLSLILIPSGRGRIGKKRKATSLGERKPLGLSGLLSSTSSPVSLAGGGEEKKKEKGKGKRQMLKSGAFFILSPRTRGEGREGEGDNISERKEAAKDKCLIITLNLIPCQGREKKKAGKKKKGRENRGSPPLHGPLLRGKKEKRGGKKRRLRVLERSFR